MTAKAITIPGLLYILPCETVHTKEAPKWLVATKSGGAYDREHMELIIAALEHNAKIPGCTEQELERLAQWRALLNDNTPAPAAAEVSVSPALPARAIEERKEQILNAVFTLLDANPVTDEQRAAMTGPAEQVKWTGRMMSSVPDNAREMLVPEDPACHPGSTPHVTPEVDARVPQQPDILVVGPCGFVPPTPGWAACTRAKGHDGPCAHHPVAGDWPAVYNKCATMGCETMLSEGSPKFCPDCQKDAEQYEAKCEREMENAATSGAEPSLEDLI